MSLGTDQPASEIRFQCEDCRLSLVVLNKEFEPCLKSAAAPVDRQSSSSQDSARNRVPRDRPRPSGRFYLIESGSLELAEFSVTQLVIKWIGN